MGDIEKYGSGIRRVISMFREEGLPDPEWKQTSGGMCVTVYNQLKKSGKYINEGINEGISEGINEGGGLLKIIASNEGINARQLSKVAGRSLTTIERQLRKLKEQGLVEHRGTRKTGGYYLMERQY